MLETATALLLGHLLGDFILQTRRMVAGKARLPMLLGHVGLVLLVTWAALGFAPMPGPILLIGISHFASDLAKQRYVATCRARDRRAGFGAFATDQAAHLAAVWLAASLWPGAWAAGLWARPWLLGLLPGLDRLPEGMALAGGLIATVWAGGYAVRELMAGLKLPADPESDTSLPLGGQIIGRLERLMILMLLLANQPDGIGLLIAAKSILRFSEVSEGDRRASEYVIIGTLASFAWAISTAYATNALLTALRGA
ncbi:DUF3307 domain-containing protein [Amaricoccus solimangrovi]|uniref:DUF3307 domain-containing protein n=1 Tax=Amaricoccus solimangrovi TaxID=2589815 RepID=A0A501WH38_9RHOB|nr:DUF3307 domain-containing protein [Amaricoccus solimangrovi]TPE47384.1 DUF3307 domain-containing protein [Amaricoccus solimangrovi]